jgi:hypothetical protein
MRALHRKRSRPQAIDDLRLAIACLPRRTRQAMLEGIARNDIIVGAYTNGDGICPMLAAHRAGGRTAFIGFAEAWDRFAQRDCVTTRARRATERELLILRSHLEASLLEEAAAPPPLAAAIADHEDLQRRRARREAERRARRDAERRARRDAERRVRPRPGDPDRSRELRRAGGWAWTRLFRRLDDYEGALRRLEEAEGCQVPAAAPHDLTRVGD